MKTIAFAAVLAAVGMWLATWVAVARWGRRRGWTPIESVGGGFVSGALALAVAGWLAVAVLVPAPPPVLTVEQCAAHVGALPCGARNERTVAQCLAEKIRLLAVQDLGWRVLSASPTGCTVERHVQVEGMRGPTIYRWEVQSGEARPVNGAALGLARAR